MKKYILSSILLFAVAIISGYMFYKPSSTLGSVAMGSGYKSVVTAPINANASYLQSGVISTTTGASGLLGSVVITATGAPFTLYDATTTNTNLRTLTATTSLRVLANFPASAAVGTYTFDEDYYQGLVIAFDSGTQGTSTITYRP